MCEFSELRVGDHISFLSGFPFASEFFSTEEGTPLIRIRDLVNSTVETKYHGACDSKWLVRAGDILIGMDGDFSIVRWKNIDALLNQRILKAVAKPNGKIDKDFFFYWCGPLLHQIHARTAATTVKHLSVRDLEQATGKFPTLVEQQYIAEILSTLDEAIEQTEALIVKTQQIKAGLMHDLFTRGVTPDGRLRPPREEAPQLYKESPLGWIPKEWEVEKLGDILNHCGGYLQTGPFGSQLHAHEYQAEGVPVVMPQDINEGGITTNQIARINEARAQELARHRMRYGDIVIARRGDLSRAAAISDSEQSWVCGTGCFLLRLGQSTLRSKFASYVYRQDFVQRQTDVPPITRHIYPYNLLI